MTTTDLANNPVAKPAVRQNPLWKRRLATLSRWLHIYLSMFSFGVLLFFAVTGLTLNHQELFSGQQRTSQYNGSLDPKWIQAGASGVGKLEIVEYLRKSNHITGAVSEFRVEDDQCEVTFKGPGYS
ncbi:MAG: PepSY-associated TM helix domain-containing protein, partial [Bryobacteraceae bacterium]